MKSLRCFLLFALFAGFAANAFAQNWTTVSAANITDLNQQKLAAGQLCFLPTDQNDNPVSVGVGGGGQLLRRSFCASVTNGAVTAFTVPNPASTAPSGVYYRVTVNDSSTGKEVLRYTQVAFSGTAFNFDGYAPGNLGQMSPLAGTSVTGNLNLSGNLAATGSVTAGPLAVPSVAINGDSAMTAAPRSIYQSFCPGTLTGIWTCSTLTLDRGITITRIQIQVKSASAGCTTSAVIRVGDNLSNNQDTTLGSTVVTDSGPIVRSFPTSGSLIIRIVTPASGCTTNPADANVLVQYRMQ